MYTVVVKTLRVSDELHGLFFLRAVYPRETAEDILRRLLDG